MRKTKQKNLQKEAWRKGINICYVKNFLPKCTFGYLANNFRIAFLLLTNHYRLYELLDSKEFTGLRLYLLDKVTKALATPSIFRTYTKIWLKCQINMWKLHFTCMLLQSNHMQFGVKMLLKFKKKFHKYLVTYMLHSELRKREDRFQQNKFFCASVKCKLCSKRRKIAPCSTDLI